MERLTQFMTTFMACDGKVFSSEESCIKHEKEVKEKEEKENRRLEIMSKLQAIDMSNNDFIREQMIDSFSHEYKAYKFVYHSDCSLMDVILMYSNVSDDETNFLYTIIDGVEKRVMLDDFPQLEVGETYLIIYYLDTAGDYRNDPVETLVKLSDYKDYYIKQINEL